MHADAHVLTYTHTCTHTHALTHTHTNTDSTYREHGGRRVELQEEEKQEGGQHAPPHSGVHVVVDAQVLVVVGDQLAVNERATRRSVNIEIATDRLKQ